jgi:hypothetical protein
MLVTRPLPVCFKLVAMIWPHNLLQLPPLQCATEKHVVCAGSCSPCPFSPIPNKQVARGDLGAELPLEEVPFWQSKIIQGCR